MKLNLQQFAGSLTVTVVKGENVTTATASPASSLSEGDEVELTIACASGYEPVIEVIAGGVTVEDDAFEMGATNVILAVTAKSSSLYKVLEETMVSINGSKTVLHKGVKVLYSPNGAVRDVEIEAVSITDAGKVAALLEAGLIEKV